MVNLLSQRRKGRERKRETGEGERERKDSRVSEGVTHAHHSGEGRERRGIGSTKKTDSKRKKWDTALSFVVVLTLDNI